MHPLAWNDFKKVNAIRIFTVVLKNFTFSLVEVLIANINIVKGILSWTMSKCLLSLSSDIGI